MASIFEKQRLTPGQLRAVAELRLDDALALLATDINARANGAIYLAGFVIECLLKAQLLERHPNLQRRVDPATLSAADAEVFHLLYRHDLDEMLVFLRQVKERLLSLPAGKYGPIWPRFRSLCEEWTVYVRYSPKLASIADARTYVSTVQEVKQWLKEP
jgi:hypothetical protein